MFLYNCSTPSQRVKPLDKDDYKGIPNARKKYLLYISFVYHQLQLVINLIIRNDWMNSLLY